MSGLPGVSRQPAGDAGSWAEYLWHRLDAVDFVNQAMASRRIRLRLTQTTSVVLVEACPASRAMSLMLTPDGGLTCLVYPGLGDAVVGRHMVGS